MARLSLSTSRLLILIGCVAIAVQLNSLVAPHINLLYMYKDSKAMDYYDSIAHNSPDAHRQMALQNDPRHEQAYQATVNDVVHKWVHDLLVWVDTKPDNSLGFNARVTHRSLRDHSPYLGLTCDKGAGTKLANAVAKASIPPVRSKVCLRAVR